MDWYSIRYLYPKSFNRFSETMFPNIGLASLSTLLYYDNKKLYYFFDKEGIFLLVERYHTSLWNFSISLHNGVCFGPGGVSKKTREEIEEEGFNECFRLLDKILTTEEL
jgi:hypothetical protein